WLPLPFVSRLLVLLVQHDRQEGFRQIAFVAAERRLQRRAVVAALVEVALQDMQAHTAADLPQVAEKLRWTSAAPAALPETLVTAVPRLERMAQHIEQYLVLHSAYRKSDALRRAIDEVEALQKSLIVARGRVAARILGVVNTWHRLLTVEYQALQAQAKEAREI